MLSSKATDSVDSNALSVSIYQQWTIFIYHFVIYHLPLGYAAWLCQEFVSIVCRKKNNEQRQKNKDRPDARISLQAKRHSRAVIRSYYIHGFKSVDNQRGITNPTRRTKTKDGGSRDEVQITSSVQNSETLKLWNSETRIKNQNK